MYRFTQPEDQAKFALPLNRDTEHLYYNTRLIYDTNVLTEPRAWNISKINRTTSKGIVVFTMAQDQFNSHTDKAQYDENGNVVAWWADWDKSNIEPSEGIVNDQSTDTPTLSSSITCSGKPQIKIGGSAKTLTVTFYDDGVATDYQSGEWSYSVDDADATGLLEITDVGDGKVRVKFTGDSTYINKILKVTFTSGEISSSLDLEILPL